jgi:hypothetical protein
MGSHKLQYLLLALGLEISISLKPWPGNKKI